VRAWSSAPGGCAILNRMSAAEQDASAWTVARLLAWTQDYLRRSDIESPRLCAEILLAHAMGCERIHLYTRFEQVPGPEVLAAYRELVKEAAAGQPIAYLTGSKEFFSLALEVGPAVLIPRPETEILVERTIDAVRRSPRDDPAILDLGTGSGCIAISLACHLPRARLFASDISEAALVIARRNAVRHGVAQRIDFRCGDLFGPWPAGEDADGSSPTRFDVIVSNPPYVATAGQPVERQVREYEPAEALFAGPDGLELIRRLLREAPGRLTVGGHLLFEMACDQGPAVRELLSGECWRQAVTYRDGAGHERIAHARHTAVDHVQVA
jgi:release factor glutamine methyltransferase